MATMDVYLTDVGKRWLQDHYPQSIVWEYDVDKPRHVVVEARAKLSEEEKAKHKKLLLVISAIMMIIVFASMLFKATKFGSFGLLLLIVILLMLSQSYGILEKIFKNEGKVPTAGKEKSQK